MKLLQFFASIAEHTSAAAFGLLLAATALAQSCPAPDVAPFPLHATGAVIELAWTAVPEASIYAAWAQWRVPEGPVVRTLELSAREPHIALPASPEPWRPLMLQVELSSQCGGAPSPTSKSAPTVLHQLQYDPAQACPPVTALQPVRSPASANGSPAPYARLRWQGQPGEHFEIAWFEAAGGRPLAGAEVQAPHADWPAAAKPPVLIRATRSCAVGRPSTPAYLLVP